VFIILIRIIELVIDNAVVGHTAQSYDPTRERRMKTMFCNTGLAIYVFFRDTYNMRLFHYLPKMNRNKRPVAVFLLALCSLLIFSCDGEHGTSDYKSYKSFAYDLQGTWESNGDDDYYSGTLVIDFNTITISGYAPNPTYEFINGTSSHQPFYGITKNIPLEGYSEEGKIQEGLSYTYWYTSPSQPDYIQIYFLSFEFDGRTETLRKQ